MLYKTESKTKFYTEVVKSQGIARVRVKEPSQEQTASKEKVLCCQVTLNFTGKCSWFPGLSYLPDKAWGGRTSSSLDPVVMDQGVLIHPREY